MEKSEAYKKFRTGLTFAEVWQSLKAECDSGKRRHVTRHTVLGRWHEIKLSMFAEIADYYERGCYAEIEGSCEQPSAIG